MASDILRGVFLFLGFVCAGSALFGVNIFLGTALNSNEFDALFFISMLVPLLVSMVALFFFRLDLRLPKDRPIRFNRHQGKVYANYYTWNHNPFGRWGGGVKVFDWNTLQAEVTRNIGASGEVIPQRY